jgi:hypothetical protein
VIDSRMFLITASRRTFARPLQKFNNVHYNLTTYI